MKRLFNKMNDEEQSTLLSRDAYSQFVAGEYAKAIELYNASLGLGPCPQALRGLGECYSALGQNREAILYFAASAGLRPFPKASCQLAEALFQGGYLDEAKLAAERAITAMPHYKAAHTLLQNINKRIDESGPPAAP